MLLPRRAMLCLFVLVALAASGLARGDILAPREKPNVVLILVDDWGYADASCYGGKINTPRVDRLAAEGIRFTDAHSTSSVCTPTRYALLTGRYNWRTKLQRGVLGGLSPSLIEPNRMTLGTMLQRQGYHTACIGKWHLGMDWVPRPSASVAELSIESREQVFNVDYAQPITRGPNDVGFDYFFGISASLDMVPYTFIENDRVVALPTEDRDFPMVLGRDTGRTRQGPTAPDFDVADVLPVLTDKSVAYIAARAEAAKSGTPFFLYVPLASPHTPIVPTPEWQETSGINFYADFVMETDAAVGRIFDALQENDLADRTIFIFTSDNGCSPQADFDQLAAAGHMPSGPLRGGKADLFEGGHRVPMVIRWPGMIKPDSVSDQIVCQTDIFATLAALLEVNLPPDAGEDSFSFLAALRGEVAADARDHLVSHSVNGSFAIRRGDWKLLLCPDSGGWSPPRPNSPQAAYLPPMQLYNLADDLGETNNLFASHPEQVAELVSFLESVVMAGRGTPGPRQENDVPVDTHARVPAR